MFEIETDFPFLREFVSSAGDFWQTSSVRMDRAVLLPGIEKKQWLDHSLQLQGLP